MSLFTKKSSPKFDDQVSPAPQKNKGSLIVLLILLGGFAYLYFFTSLIVPHETEPAKAPAGAPEIKSTMPPKSTAQPATVSPVAVEAKKPEAASPAPQTPPVAPAPAPVPKPAAPAAAPKPTAAQPAPAPQQPAVAKPAPQQPAAKSALLPPPQAAPKKESAVPVKKEEAASVKAAQPALKKEEPKVVKAAVSEKSAVKKADSYTVFVGEYPAGDDTAAVEAKLAKLAIKHVVKHETKKSRTMNRLYYGVYIDYDAYLSALEKVRQSGKGAFGVEKDGKYYVYAGSFSSRERAEKEKRDLSAKGLTLLTQQVVIPLSTVRITAGLFSSKAEADKAAARMKSEGLVVKVVTKGR